MKIENLRLHNDPPTPKGFKRHCTFSVQVNSDIRLYEMQLLQAPDGRYLVVPPKHPNGAPMCSLSPELRDEIAKLASRELISSYAKQAGDWFNTNYLNHQKAR
ncbi:hypothetical protein [Pseudorhizobium flavum]|jgi:hypothetical protein|uniref:Uncharacterized protein n=1 Tax=Pseudorhizobium flavum TaxID=1335061 RepID=A0A7W9Z165_9HYPH|nr:hypothetical protein [Pseudorhizobium flavum]MBB6182140.1 hypothetical protein [Pseudorhizobium flavum]CAD6631966.1 hypothetical protein RFYW14_04567 [Pseudorhizobium flavum]